MRRWTLVAIVLATLSASACELPPQRVIAYRIATRGPVTAEVAEFAASVQQTLNDPRGWSLGNAVAYRQVEGPAAFTVVLATAGSLPSFGPPCSTLWSCRSGSNVIINENRWLGATPSWPFGLDAYRDYVVNHEVGHWAGLGHPGCGGGLAPVMLQQSKGGAVLGSCGFNVWPLEWERAAAAANLNVGRLPIGLAQPDIPFGHVDAFGRTGPDTIRVVGWAVDGDATGPIDVAVLVDGVIVTTVPTGAPRPDVVDVYWNAPPDAGFNAEVSIGIGPREACLVALGPGAGWPFGFLDCKTL